MFAISAVVWYDDTMFLDTLRAALADHDASPWPLITGADEIVECRRLLDRVEAGLLAAVHEVAVDGSIEAVSGLSPAEWFAARCGRTHRDAAATLRLSTRLARSTIVADELATGGLSLGQAAAIVAASTERSAALFAEYEANAVATAKRVSTDDLTRVMRMWKRRADEATRRDDDRMVDEKREVFLSPVGDQEWELNGTLTAESGEVLKQALDAAMRQDHEGDTETRTARQRRADALTASARQWLEHHAIIRIHGARPQLLVTVNLDDLRAGVNGPGGVTSSGMILDGATIARLACDCVTTRIMRASSVDVDVSAPTAEIPIAMRRAVIARDQHCRVEGCTRPGCWAEIHHIIEQVDGGEHRVTNLVMICSFHHQRIHRLKLRVWLDPDGTFHMIDLNGRDHTTRPPPNTITPAAPPLDDPAAAAWRAAHIRNAIRALTNAVNLGSDDYRAEQHRHQAVRRRLTELQHPALAA